MAKAEILKDFIRSFEGGYCNVPGDKGGHTNKGITLATYRSVYGSGKSVDDLKRMTDAQWDFIYQKLYWNKWKADEINSQSIANLLVDWYWNSGAYGIRIPQFILGVTQDGIVGPKTIAAINNYKDGEKALFQKLWKERESYYMRIAIKEKKKFLTGWLRRLNGIQYGRLVCNGGKVIDY